MRMLVPHGRVSMPVRMRFGDRTIVIMLMVLVMHVAMLVLHCIMRMLMVMTFAEVEP